MILTMNQLTQKRIKLPRRNQPLPKAWWRNHPAKKAETSSDDSDSEDEAPAKVAASKPVAKPAAAKKESSSDDSDSSEDDTPPTTKKKETTVKKESPAKPVVAPPKAESSSDDSDSSEEQAPSKPVNTSASVKKAEKSSSDDSSSDDEAPVKVTPKPAATTTIAGKVGKRKAKEADAAAAASPNKKSKFCTSTPAPVKKGSTTPSPEESCAESAERDSGIEDDKNKFASGSKKTANAPFRRIQNYGEIVVDKKVSDNSFESKAGFDTWGAKASQDLIVTKGKSFRHEKTKKKRGSYKGGPINMGVASIKFDSD